MTAIAAFTDGRTAALAYDSAMTQGDLRRIDLRKRPAVHDLRSPKGKPRGRLVIAACGTGRLIHEVVARFEPPPRRRAQDAGDYMVDVAERLADLLVAPGARADRFVTDGDAHLHGEMVAIVDARVFQIGCTFGVTEPACGFIAVGNASELLTGALAALEDQLAPVAVRRAVEIACEHFDGVAAPIQIETTARERRQVSRSKRNR